MSTNDNNYGLHKQSIEQKEPNQDLGAQQKEQIQQVRGREVSLAAAHDRHAPAQIWVRVINLSVWDLLHLHTRHANSNKKATGQINKNTTWSGLHSFALLDSFSPVFFCYYYILNFCFVLVVVVYVLNNFFILLLQPKRKGLATSQRTIDQRAPK